VAAEPRGGAGRCTNCGATATGVYCARCGQRIEPHVHTVSRFLREATESLTHADSRLWRTLITLLAKPGRLTREFLDGRRVSYLPPFRLYLVLSLLFFVIASLLGGTDLAVLDEMTKPPAVAGAKTSPEPRTALEDLSKEVASLRTSSDPDERAAGEQLDELTQARCTFALGGNAFLDWLQPRMQRGCEQTLADGGRALGREFMLNLPRMLFLFLPLIAFVMMLMYWLPRRYYVEHLLFFVHNHSFTFLLFLSLILVSAALPRGVGDFLELAVFVYAAWYLFRAMRVVYGQGRALTLAKYATLSVVYLVLLTALSVVTLFYSLTTV
jgi:hypothetical protein